MEQNPHILHTGRRMDVERTAATQHLVPNHPQGPPVDRIRVPNAQIHRTVEDLGRNVRFRAGHRRRQMRLLQYGGNIEVGYVEMSLLVQ